MYEAQTGFHISQLTVWSSFSVAISAQRYTVYIENYFQ
jgi:hypothetical protein